MTAKNTSVMADKVFVGTIDSNTKLSVKVIDQLNLKSEPQYLKQEDDGEDGVTDVRLQTLTEEMDQLQAQKNQIEVDQKTPAELTQSALQINCYSEVGRQTR